MSIDWQERALKAEALASVYKAALPDHAAPDWVAVTDRVPSDRRIVRVLLRSGKTYTDRYGVTKRQWYSRLPVLYWREK